MKASTRILIATPMSNGVAKAGYVSTLFGLVHCLRDEGIHTDLMALECSDITAGRNAMATRFLQNESHTHLLFIDADMEFTPDPILKMLALNAPLVAAACTRRRMDVEVLAQAAYEAGRAGKPFHFEALRADLMRYNVRLSWDSAHDVEVEMRGGFVQAAGVGTAVMLIARDALIDMLAAGVAGKNRIQQPDGSISTETVYGFFDPVIPAAGVSALSEDFSFCHRWTKQMNRHLWVLTDAHIRHIGDFAFEGHYLTQMMGQVGD